MTSRYEAYMNGVALSSLDPSIYVLDIQPGEVKKSIQTSKVANKPGARLIRTDDDSASCTVLFEIHEYNTVKREAIRQKVCKWAVKGILKVSDRPEQILNCICASFPKATAKAWTETLSVTFIAYNPPYWQDDVPTKVSFTATGSKAVYIPGNAPLSLVSATITAGGALSSITLQTGEKQLVLNDIGASANDVISIGYDENKILYIKKNTTSILNKRTASSDDELTVACGEYNTFAVTCSASFSAEFSVRGCWY